MVRNLFRDLYRRCTGPRRPYVRPNKPQKKMQLQMELLEDRLTPSPVPVVFTVTNDNDSGPGSLRAEVQAADNGGVYSQIVFDNTFQNSGTGGVYDIVLSSGPIDITVPMQINATGSQVTVNGNGDQIFVIPQPYSINVTFIGDPGSDPADPNANNFILTGGYASVAVNGDVSNNGGAIDAEDPNGAIALYNMEIIGNSADGNGGGVYSAGSLGVYGVPTQSSALYTSYIEGNTADVSGMGGNGGGLYAGFLLTVDQSYVLDNSADNGGGAYAAGNPQALVYFSAFQDNQATGGATGAPGNGGGLFAKWNAFVIDSEFGGFDANGQAAGNTATGNGAGVYACSGNAQIDSGSFGSSGTAYWGGDSLFQFNETNLNGGAVWAYNGVMVGSVTSTSPDFFSQNYAGGSGGAIYSVHGLVTVTETGIFGNTAATGQGGGIWSGGTVNVLGSEIGLAGPDTTNGLSGNNPITGQPYVAGNFAKGDGGGIWAARDVNIVESAVDNNSSRGNGGGIADYTWVVNLLDAEILSNTAAKNGGGVYSNGGEIDVGTEVPGTFNYIVGNQTGANGLGGGLYQSSGSINIIADALILGNTAGSGGGIYIGSGSLFMDGSQGPATPDYNFAAGPATEANVTTVYPVGTFGLEIAYNKSLAASTTANSGGGGVDAQSSQEVTILFALFEGNTANSNGGGLLAFNVQETQVSYSTFEANQSISGNQGGGGIYAVGAASSFTADDDTISANKAKTVGGGMYLNVLDAYLDHLTFTDNSVTGSVGVSGRDLYVAGGKTYLENDLFADFLLSTSSGPGSVSEIGGPAFTTGLHKGQFLYIISMGHNLTTDNSLAKVQNFNIQNGDIANGHQTLDPKAINLDGLTPTYNLVNTGNPATSQAIGGGDSVGPPIDQNNEARPGNGVASDIGAVQAF